MGRGRKNKKADRKKLPAVALGDDDDQDCFPEKKIDDQNWRGKNFYLRCLRTTRIWGIEAFKLIDGNQLGGKVADRFGEFEYLLPTVVCDWDYFKQKLPLEMGVFTFDGKAYMVGGETTGDLRPEFLSRNMHPWEKWVEPSDKVYEFLNPPDFTLHELPAYLRLPSPMRSPIVAKIDGSVYVLYGDHCYNKAAMPSDSTHCFVVLEKDDGRPIDQCRWRPLPTPPFYQKGTPDYSRCSGCYKFKLGVIGHKLYVSAGTRGYAFDALTGEWELMEFGYPLGSESLSSMLKLNVGCGQKDCFVVVGAECFPGIGAFVALVDCKTGYQLHKQLLPEAYDVRLPVSAFQVIELQEEEHDDDRQLSSTFCFVYTTGNHLVGLTVLRFSLPAASASSLPLTVATKASKKASKQKVATSSMNGKTADGGIHLNVEVLEKCLYIDSDPSFYPADFHAFFL
ncbi:unnamed protein product [Linum trigynum]|uniref:Uncharacterized protein n=1 Tax=Linum trigynum TaxID=586398 RepID=A0AAV2C802_9ROSI